MTARGGEENVNQHSRVIIKDLGAERGRERCRRKQLVTAEGS